MLASTIKQGAVLVTIIGGLVAAFVQFGEYLAQRERLARFEVGPEVTKLAQDLNNWRDQEQQKLAAYQLAWFGRPAVFLLSERLVAEDNLAVRRAIVTALVEIVRTEAARQGLLQDMLLFLSLSEPDTPIPELLADWTTADISLTLDAGEPDTGLIGDRLAALAEVAAALDVHGLAAVEGESPRTSLESVRASIEAESDEELSGRKQEFLELIDEILSRIKS